MGEVSPERKDTRSFALTNPHVREMVLRSPDYFHAAESEKAKSQQQALACIDAFWRSEIGHDGPFGWKMGISLFTMLPLLDACPDAKVIHLVRDGRDVMLSRLNARIQHLDDPANRVAVFGSADVATIGGLPLTQDLVEAQRNELEMRHWVTAVGYGIKGREYPDRYLEVRYETLCREPVETFAKIFDFLGVRYRNGTRHWLKDNVYTSRMGKWRELPADELAKPLEIGRPLLTELGYL
jgi:hypothetical protein